MGSLAISIRFPLTVMLGLSAFSVRATLSEVESVLNFPSAAATAELSPAAEIFPAVDVFPAGSLELGFLAVVLEVCLTAAFLEVVLETGLSGALTISEAGSAEGFVAGLPVMALR